MFTVLFLCTGNICRSPLAQQLLTARLTALTAEVATAEPLIAVQSAGLHTATGVPMDAQAASESSRHGGDPTGSASRVFTPRLARTADLVLTMTVAHQLDAVQRVPALLGRTYTLRQFERMLPALPSSGDTRLTDLVALAAKQRRTGHPESDSVPDPFRRSPEIHASVADLIDANVTPLATWLLGR
ncbi:MAG: low molecular weight phosphatase family protein [Burkholderiaceae bacterium]|nr:low molecular weight phosphatase family protein [Microbacteriaceae bacterium]